MPARRNVTASVRWICPVPVLLFVLLEETRVEGLIAFGSIASRPKKFGMPPVSVLVRAAEVTFFRFAASFMLTRTVTISPTWAARWSLKNAREPDRHSAFASLGEGCPAG